MVAIIMITIDTLVWTFAQSSGIIYTPKYEPLVMAYAGHGEGKNNPALQDKHRIGPLPIGFYIIEEPKDDTQVGKYAMRLTPLPENNMYGRSDFFIHGDNPEHIGESSDGCIVAGPTYRTRIWTDTPLVHLLQVIA